MEYNTKQLIKDIEEIKSSSLDIDEKYIKVLECFFAVHDWKAPAIELPVGTHVYRCRKSEADPFLHIDSLTTKPLELAKNYERASRPGFTPFYGAIPSNLVGYAPITCVMETSLILREPGDYPRGELEYTILQCHTNQPTYVVPVVTIKSLKDPSFHKLRENINSKLKKLSPASIELHEYVATHFEGPGTIENYLVSSAFANKILYHYIVHNGKLKKNDIGILYPSHRTDGEGINVAIPSKEAEKCLDPKHVLEMRIYYQGNQAIGDNLRQSDIEADGSFNLKEITDPNVNMGRRRSLQLLGHNLLQTGVPFGEAYDLNR